MVLFKSKNKIDNVELAYQLFRTLGVGGNPDYKYKDAIDRIYSECTDKEKGYAPQKTILLKVVELAGNPDTSKQRYILAQAYSWLGAKYRQQAIECIKLYIEGPLIDTSKIHLAEMYDKLGAAYEGEYEFQRALQAYTESLKLDSYFPTPYIKVIDVLRKMNRLDLALKVIENAKLNPQYHAGNPVVAPEYDFNNMNTNKVFEVQQQQWNAQLSNTFTNAINVKEQEIRDKIAKGYVYRPRKKKS